ncbi:MAG: ATP-binding cassette domain-containing protein [Rickettsiales bacterium]
MDATSEKPLLRATGVTVARGGKTLLNDVSFSMEAHDFVTVVGPNGAGKSLLLKTLTGLFRVDKGTVEKKPGLRIGYMPQRFAIDPSVPIDAGYFLRLRKKASPDAEARALEETGAGALLSKRLADLSGGETQRVLLARALLGDPELLILDEPAQNLDLPGQLAFYRLLDSVYRSRKLAVLMVSHDFHMVMASTRRVLCLFHHVCCAGEPHVVARDPQFVALFGEETSRLMATYRHAHDHTHAKNA